MCTNPADDSRPSSEDEIAAAEEQWLEYHNSHAPGCKQPEFLVDEDGGVYCGNCGLYVKE